MNKKGFTLIELLAAILIISVLGAIGIVSYRNIFKKAEDRYYNSVESNMLLAGNDYFEDHRNEIPIGSEYTDVSLNTLVSEKYMEEVIDTEGNLCSSGSVFAYRENNKLKYEACLKCDNYETSGRFCNTISSRLINVRGKKEGSTEYDYDVLKSYNRQGYSDGKNIIVNLSMDNEFQAVRYTATNTKNAGIQKECSIGNNNSCDVEIEETGVYRVIAYDNNDNEVSSRYINIKIAKGGSNFELEGETEYLISKSECSNGAKTKNVKITIIPEIQEEYKKIEYQINGGEIQESVGLNLNLPLGSGHYDIDVNITNYANNVSTKRISVDISYLVNVQYDDGTSTTHEVIKGQTYNYLSELPTKKDGRDITWYKNSVLMDPSIQIVTDDCTHTINGETYVTYTISYDYDGGSVSSANPTRYNENTPTFTLNNPTKSGYTFLGWTGSNDISTGLGGYTTSNPYIADGRDNYTGNEFAVVSGDTYRVFVTAKRTAGNLDLRGGIWYTEKTSGNSWDGCNPYFVEIEDLGDGWSRYYKEIVIPAGKTKGKIYILLEQWPVAATTTWQVADMHVVKASSNISIPKGSTGDRTYKAYFYGSHTLTINPNGGTYTGTTTITNTSGTEYTIPNNLTRPGYVFSGWTLSGKGAYYVYDSATSTATETNTINYNSSSSTGFAVYNNSGGGTVTAAMVSDSTATGGYSLKLTTNGTASPGAGGFTTSAFPTTPGRINVVEVKAKIPTGYTLRDGGNGAFYRGMGQYIDNTRNVSATDKWITQYLYYYTGYTGEFTPTIYFNVSGSNNQSVTWNVNSVVVRSFTRDNFKSKYTFGAGNATLTAKWTAGGSGVTFNTNGGSFDSTYVKSWTNSFYSVTSTTALRHYTYNTSYATHPGSTNYNWTPDSRVTTKTGYTLDGWYTAATGGTKVFNADGTLVPSTSGYSDSTGKWLKYDANVTLYAHWASQSYTVTYNENLGQMDAWGTSYKDRWTRTYDSSTGLYTIACAGAGGWELLYLPISTTSGHQYKVTFDYAVPTAYTTLTNYSGIGYQAVTQLGNNDLSSVSLATSYLPKAVTSKTSGTLTFTATGTTTYFVFNFGMAADSVTTSIKAGNVKVYDVTSSKYVFAPSPTTQTKSYGGQYGTLSSVSRTGYTFNGWYTAPSGGTKIETTSTYNTSGNQTLYAHWTMGTYSQVYRSNGGNAGNSASETIGYWDVWISKAASTYNKAGYTFNCWQSSTSSSCYSGNSWYYTSASTGTSRYLDATWTANNYTLTFNANGGSVSPTTKSVTYGTTYTDLPTPTRSGYTFKGWYGTYNGSNYTNYGRAYMYTNKLSVHLSAYMTNWSNYGRAISCTESGGWNIEPNSGNISGACYDSGVGYKSAISSTAFSSLSSGWHDFDLIFNGTNAELYVDGTLRGTSSNYSSGKIGYHATNSIFLGGEAASSNSTVTSSFFTGNIGNVVIKNTDEITPSTTYNSISAPAQDQTLYARWDPITYKVTLDNQSATSAGTTQVWYQYNTTGTISGTTCYYYTNSNLSSCLTNGYTINIPTKTGYVFGGYYTEKNGAGTQYVNASGTFVNSIYKTTGNKTLYAKWTLKTTPTLTISAISGTVVKGKTLTFTIKSNVEGKFDFSSSATGIATVSPATQSVAANTEYTVTVTGVADGSATITSAFTPTDTTNYTTASKTYTATITKSATIPTAASYCNSLTFNDSIQTLVKNAGTGYTWTAGTTRKDAGSQNVTATLSSGYRWSDNTTGTKTISCSIAKANPTLTISATSGTVVKGKTLTYTIKSNIEGTFANSSGKTSVATVSPASQSAAANTTYTVTITGVADGSATITSAFTPKSSNYNTASKTYTATITKSATIPTAASYCNSLTFNDSIQTLVKPAGTGYTWTAGTTRKDAGSQNVTATLSSGYRWSDNGTGTKTISCSIAKATPTFVKTETSKNIYNGRSDTYGLIPNVAGSITSSSNSTGVATVSQASNCSSIGANAQCVITVTGKSVGSATMTHTFTPSNNNYNSVTTTMPVNILNSNFTVTFAGAVPISTSLDNQTVTLAGNVAVPVVSSSTLNLAANTSYTVSFNYKAASGSNQFDVDFFPDGLPQTNPTATSTQQHIDWVTSSTDSRMTSCQLRFFDDFQGSGETDITITNIMLSRNTTKGVVYGNTYGDLPAPTRSGYVFDGWYTASSGGTKITSSSTVSTTSNHTLYARWSKPATTYRWKATCYCQLEAPVPQTIYGNSSWATESEAASNCKNNANSICSSKCRSLSVYSTGDATSTCYTYTA